MRIVNSASNYMTCVPGEGRVTRLLCTEHLITPINLEDADTTLRTRLRLTLDKRSRGLRILITCVLCVAVITLNGKTVWTCVLRTYTTLIRSREIATTVICGAVLNEYTRRLSSPVILRSTSL